MSALLKVISLIVLATISGCFTSDPVVETRSIDVKVLKIDPPKRYYVTFQHVEDGTVVKKNISKRCSTYKQIKIGEVYKITVVVKETSNKEKYFEYPNLKKVFCPK